MSSSNQFIKVFCVGIGAICLIYISGCSGKASQSMHLYQKIACQTDSKSVLPWHISNLYNCNTNSFFIPYQLWTGSTFDGSKNTECMHRADLDFNVDNDSPTNIKGPIEWLNPKTQKTHQIWVRSKKDNSKVQHFTCHENGIGRVYDSRGNRLYLSGRCKFPAGYGWKVGQKRSCKNTAIEITDISIDEKDQLSSIDFKWWVNGIFDHKYRYVRGKGLTRTWDQR